MLGMKAWQQVENGREHYRTMKVHLQMYGDMRGPDPDHIMGL